MSELKRYMHSDQRGSVEVVRGKYVLYEDYAELKAQRDALQEKADFKQNLTEQIVELQKQRDALAAENANLRHLLDMVGETGNANFGRTKLPIPATDAYINSVRADAVERLWSDSLNDVGHVLAEIGAYQDASEAAGIVHSEIQERVDDFAAQLRSGEPS